MKLTAKQKTFVDEYLVDLNATRAYKAAYKRLLQIEKEKPKKKIEIGDSVENLMSADSHKKVKGAIRQTRWG